MILFILQGLIWTVIITVGSFAFGSIIGVLVAGARTAASRVLRIIGRVYVEIIRSVPPLVWLFLVFFGLAELGLRLTPFQAAIITFSMIASAYLGEIYRGGLATLGRGQIEASNSLGLSRFDLLVRIVSPQVLRTVSPSMVTYGIGLMKDSALASTIGVVEMTFRANQVTQSTGQGLAAFAIVGGAYLLLSIPLGAWARSVDEKMRKKYVVN
ncbi:MAG TPA: amino acid ABC transporter permease [Microbacteriaceae bacterium]